MSTVSLRRPSTIASASLASSPASLSTQLARLWTISRIRPSLASSARAVQRIAASSIGTWRSSLIATASAWPSSGDTSILREPVGDRAFDQAAEPLVVEAFEQVGDQPRWRRWRMRVSSPSRRLEEAAGGAGEVDVAHPPRDHRRDQEIFLEEIGQRLADAVLVARDDRGVRDRQAERVAEQGGDREPVGQAADHRRLGERLDLAEPRVGGLELRARRRTRAAIDHQQAGRGGLHPAPRPAGPG